MRHRTRRIVAVCALTGAGFAAVFLAVRSTEPTGHELTAVFESANGMIAGGEVRAGGVRIGTITEITLADDGYPHVTLRVDEDYVVRTGATANVRLGSQAGQLNRFVDIDNGAGAALADGSTLGLARTDQPVEVNDLLSVLTPDVREEVQDLVARTDRTLEGRGPDLDKGLRESGAALDQVAGLLGDVTADRAALRRLVERTNAGVSQVAETQDELSAATDRTARLLDVAAARQLDIGETLMRAPEALEAPRGLLRRVPRDLPPVRRALRTARTETAQLGEVARELQRATSVAPEALDAAYALTQKTQANGPLIERLMTGLTPAVQVGSKALTELSPVLDQFRTRLPDALSWIFLMGDASASYDAAGHGLRTFEMLVEPPRKFTGGPGDCSAGLLRRPFDRVPGALACEPWDAFAKTFVGGSVDPRDATNATKTESQDEGLE